MLKVEELERFDAEKKNPEFKNTSLAKIWLNLPALKHVHSIALTHLTTTPSILRTVKTITNSSTVLISISKGKVLRGSRM